MDCDNFAFVITIIGSICQLTPSQVANSQLGSIYFAVAMGCKCANTPMEMTSSGGLLLGLQNKY
jgi:hypothetical protein